MSEKMLTICPDCNRPMGVEDRGVEGVRVECKGTAPVAVCCQRAATVDHSCIGMFLTGY